MTSLTYTLLQFPNLRGRFYYMITFFVILTCLLVIITNNISRQKEIVESQNISNFALEFINRHEISTYLDLEKKHSLCWKKFIESAPPEHPDCPKSGIVTVMQGGRLGNQIWEYMSVWLVAKKTGLKPYVPKCIKQSLSKLFDNLNIPEYDDIRSCSLVEEKIEKIEVTRGSSPWIYNHSIILPRCIVEPELLDNINDISKVFTIKEKLLDESQKILYSGLSFLNTSADSVFIGVHIRRTDYLSYINRKFQLVPDILKFIRAAMAYYEHKFHNSIFILVSDDPKWCWNNFHTKNNVYVSGKLHKSHPELDIALMASCNHSIIDYGTFGQWGALLAGGETIFYPIHMKYSSDKLGKSLKNWHTLN